MSTLLQSAASRYVSQETIPGQAAEFGNGNNTTDKLISLPTGMLADNPWQTRLVYTDIAELAEDIRRNGLLQPPTGRLVDSGTLEPLPASAYQKPAWQIASEINKEPENITWHVQLSIGHRRLRACKEAGLETMPVFLRPISDEEMARQAWAENEQRKDISAIEEALAIRGMMDSFGWTQERVAERLGLNRSTVANKLRLLGLDEETQQRVMSGELGERHARALLVLSDA
ncbi:MAG: ParB/RepB/Spo0J family partition protein, partial [Caldilineaceae bacterium]